jgi:transcriptional regulator with XRE-family HTH domain
MEDQMALRRKLNRLREVRKARGLSGYDLQVLTRIPAQEIYRIERGLRRVRPYEKEWLAKALQEEVETVFPEELERSKEIEGMENLNLSNSDDSN